MHEIFKSNRKLRASQQVKALSDDYEKILEKLTNTNICLDPRMKNNEARYSFPNCHVIMVYSEGVNPVKIRTMMTSLLPINTGLCKHLCCVKNVDLFPFITKKHIKTFYKKLHEDYLKREICLTTVLTSNSFNSHNPHFFKCFCSNQE